MDEQNFVPPEHGQKHVTLMFILSVFGLIGVVLVSVFFYREYMSVVSTLDTSIQSLASVPVVHEKKSTICPAPIVSEHESASSTPVLLYTKQLYTVTGDDGREFPTIQLLRKKDGAESEILTEVGKVGEYPAQFVLSHDKTKVAINLENKLRILNVQTKQTYDLFFSKKIISAVAFSPDDKQIFIVSEEPTPDYVGDFDFHIFTLDDCGDKTVYQEKHSTGTFFEAVWRDDNVVVLNKGYGEGLMSYVFTISAPELKQIDSTVIDVSKSGKYVLSIKDWVTDVCNDFSGSVPNVYEIIEPVSGSVLGTVGSPDNQVQIIVFSSDEQEVLYSVEKPWKYREECSKEAAKTYYTANIKTGVATKVTDLDALVSSWKTNYVGAHLGNGGNGSSAIFINNEPVVTSTSSIQIIDQYFE